MMHNLVANWCRSVGLLLLLFINHLFNQVDLDVESSISPLPEHSRSQSNDDGESVFRAKKKRWWRQASEMFVLSAATRQRKKENQNKTMIVGRTNKKKYCFHNKINKRNVRARRRNNFVSSSMIASIPVQFFILVIIICFIQIKQTKCSRNDHDSSKTMVEQQRKQNANLNSLIDADFGFFLSINDNNEIIFDTKTNSSSPAFEVEDETAPIRETYHQMIPVVEPVLTSSVSNQQLQELNLNLSSSLSSSINDNNTIPANNSSSNASSSSSSSINFPISDEMIDEDRPLIIGIITANSIIFVIGLCGNAIVILVILRFTRIETVTDIYILNLAFADLMFILGLVFLITTMFIDHWIFGNLMCKLYMATTSLNQFASSLLLVIMSFDRFLAVCHPIYAQRFRRLRRAKIICLCIWITCLILMTPIFAFARTNKDMTCAIFWPDYKSFNCEIAFTLYSFGIGFALPLLLIAAFYICVIRKLRIAASGPLNLGSTRRSRTRENTNKRIEHLVIGIICTYTICWLPYWITQLCVSFTTHLEHSPIQGFYSFFLIATSLSYTNSALNPILYAFLSDNFKRRCSDVFRSIYSINWCRPSPCTESHSTVTTTCYASEISRPESRQATMLNESLCLMTTNPNQVNTSMFNHNSNSNNNSNNNCNNNNSGGLAALARSTLDPAGDHRGRFDALMVHRNDDDLEDYRINDANNSNHNDLIGMHRIGDNDTNEDDLNHMSASTSRLNQPPSNDPNQRKKSVNFSVDTFVVQGLNNETVKSNHKILQMDKNRCHGV